MEDLEDTEDLEGLKTEELEDMEDVEDMEDLEELKSEELEDFGGNRKNWKNWKNWKESCYFYHLFAEVYKPTGTREPSNTSIQYQTICKNRKRTLSLYSVIPFQFNINLKAQ